MSLQVNINLDVPALPDNSVWFANSAAWVNYFKDINVTATFDAAVSAIYNESPFDAALESVNIVYNGVATEVPTKEQFDSLLAAYQTLNADYKALKTVLKNMGLITNS